VVGGGEGGGGGGIMGGGECPPSSAVDPHVGLTALPGGLSWTLRLSSEIEHRPNASRKVPSG